MIVSLTMQHTAPHMHDGSSITVMASLPRYRCRHVPMSSTRIPRWRIWGHCSYRMDVVDRPHIVVIFKRLSAHSILKILAIHLCRPCHSPYPNCNSSTESQNAGTNSLYYFAYVLRHLNRFNSCLVFVCDKRSWKDCVKEEWEKFRCEIWSYFAAIQFWWLISRQSFSVSVLLYRYGTNNTIYQIDLIILLLYWQKYW